MLTQIKRIVESASSERIGNRMVSVPVVNVSVQEGKCVTKTVERDDRGLITKVIEGYDFFSEKQ